MNCLTADKLSQYVDEILSQQELTDIHRHITSCYQCMKVVEAYEQEKQFLIETLQTPTLPDNFADVVLDKVEPYKRNNKIRRMSKIIKPLSIIAASIMLAVGISVTVTPSFAEWIDGLFSTEQVDDGLRLASNAGFTDRVNLEVTDQNISFKVEDIVADTSRVALSYQTINKKGKILDVYLNPVDLKNEVYVTDLNGKKLDKVMYSWSKKEDYGLIEFSLREYESLEEIVVHFKLAQLDGTSGKWDLEVPVNLKESLKSTTTVNLDKAQISKNGVNINMKEIRFAPSSNELLYETSFTKEEQIQIEEKIQKQENQFGQESLVFTNFGTAIQYRLENEKMEAVYHHNFLGESNMGLLQGSGQPIEKVGHTAWNESFIPQNNNEKLTFVLDGVFKTVPSDFSIKIKPKELNNKPISFEYKGNYLTIRKATTRNKYSLKKSVWPLKTEKIFTIEMEGAKDVSAVNLGVWVLVDQEGRTYITYNTSSVLNEKDENGRNKITMDLRSYDVINPEEITLHLLSETGYEEIKDKWKVPLYNDSLN